MNVYSRHSKEMLFFRILPMDQIWLNATEKQDKRIWINRSEGKSERIRESLDNKRFEEETA